MSTRRLFLVVLAALAISQSEARAADWIRLQSANFTFEGDAGERELRAVARRLEQFREVIGRELPSAKLVAPLPVTVLVFAHTRDFKAVVPLYNGKPIDATGYAVVGSAGVSISLSVEDGDSAYPVVYHEFAHLLLVNAFRNFPLWLQEGMAEYYRTFELSDDGRRAVLGKPIASEQFDLLRGRMLPMSELLSADETSALYNVGQDRNRFYAQSWLLVHYLLLGNPDRARQFRDFVARLAAGTPAGTAFTEAFPNADTLRSELSNYVERPAYRIITIPFADRVGGVTEFVEARMTPAESIASVGHVLAQEFRFTEAEARFAQALALAPGTASAHVGIGLVRAMQNRPLDALGPLREGVRLDEQNAMAQYALGLAAFKCQVAGCDKAGGGAEAARKAFARAVELCPQFPEALAYLGFAEMVSGGNLDDAERHVSAAIAYLPGRDDYRLYLAQVYMRRGELAKAQATLGPIAAMSADAATKASARELLGRLAGMMQMSALKNAPPAPAGGPPPAGAPAANEPSASSLTIPIYRNIRQGEQRAEGTLAAIECARGAIVAVIRDGAASHRFSAPSFDAIDFITYRDDLTGKISCGPQAGAMRVYLTWRAPATGEPAIPAGTEGRVVAIEYLPVK